MIVRSEAAGLTQAFANDFKLGSEGVWARGFSS